MYSSAIESKTGSYNKNGGRANHSMVPELKNREVSKFWTQVVIKMGQRANITNCIVVVAFIPFY